MKYFSLISAILLSLTSVNVLADKYICKHLEGHLAPLRFDPECHIKYEKPDHFPDVTFFFERPKIHRPYYPEANLCFSSVLTATLGDNKIPFRGTVYSGITLNDIGADNPDFPHLLSAASVINLPLGKVFTKDVIDAPYAFPTNEVITMVDGSKKYKEGKGVIFIHGNALTSSLPVLITGNLCNKK